MKLWILPISFVALTGCASLQIPPEKLERSEAAIRSAEEVGAAKVPAAKLHIQLARDQTEAAKKLAANGDARALLVLDRAQSDAELALVLAREVATHGDAVKAAEDLRALQTRTTP